MKKALGQQETGGGQDQPDFIASVGDRFLLLESSRLQNRDRPAPQAIGHALDGARRQRDHCPALSDPERPLGIILGIAFGRLTVNKFVAHPLRFVRPRFIRPS